MKLKEMNMDAVLCYVSNGTAYFTDQELSKQWGDDWDDAPYEHNAGEPYSPHDDNEKWNIYKVMVAGMEEPCEGYLNSRWSVQDINAGAVPWLSTPKWCSGKRVFIKAGTTLRDFIGLVHEGGGEVYAMVEKN